MGADGQHSQRARFLAALSSLAAWHSDSVKAQAYDGPSISASKPGSRVLFSRSYPGWSHAWDAWRGARSDAEREAVIKGLRDERRACVRRPHRLVRYRDAWGKTRYRTEAAE